MKFLGRAGILFLTSFFLISTSFADGAKSDRKTTADESTAAATAESGATPESAPSADAAAQPVVAATSGTSANRVAMRAAKPAPKTSTSRRPESDEQSPKWAPMPALDGNPGLFTLETGEILPKGGFSISVSGNKFSRMPGNITVLQIVPAFGVGITRWLSVFAVFQPHDHIHVGQPKELSLNTPTSNPQFQNTIYRSLLPGTGDPPAYVEDYPFASHSGSSYGEVDLGFKIGLLSERRGSWASLSIRNDFYLPTRTGLGSMLTNQVQYGNFSYGVGLEASKRILHRSILATIDWSYRFMREQTFNVAGGTPPVQVLDLGDQMRTGIGLLMFPDKRFNIITEYSSLIYLRQGLPNTSLGARDPVDNITGIRLYLGKRVAMDVGYRYAMNLNNHLDRNGFIAKLAGAYWPENPREPDSLTATCSVDKPSVMEGSNDLVQATAVATDSYGHPLSYSWTATAGKISGSGPYARWESDGVAAGNYALTAHVDDGAGKTSSCSASITVQPKPAAAGQETR